VTRRLLLAFLGALLTACASTPLARFSFTRPAMGTEFRLEFFARGGEHAAAAAEAAFARIAALERALSDYDSESELARLGARADEGAPGAWLPVSSELFGMLVEAQAVARASGGAFDVTVGPCTRLWRRAQRQGELPDEARLCEALRAVGHEKLALDPGTRSVRLLTRGMRLDPGGIGKGYALDEALRVLAEHGIERALAVGGGDIAARAAPPERAGWRVAIAGLDSGDPAEDRAATELFLAHAALSTSGDLVRSFELDGVRYAHILDPRNGRALTERRLASVLAPSGARADAWATALAVLGPRGLAALAREPGAEGRIAVLTPSGVELFESAHFPGRLSCGSVPPRPAGQSP
jgi:thiamine biosynthesis lipoprotein